RRSYRRGGGHHRLLHHSVFRRLAHPHQRRGHPHRLRLRGGGGDLFRLLSRPQGGAAQPHRGLEIRMIARLLPTMLLAALWTFPALAQTYTFTPQSSRDLVLTFQTQREGASRVLIQAQVPTPPNHSSDPVIIKP